MSNFWSAIVTPKPVKCKNPHIISYAGCVHCHAFSDCHEEIVEALGLIDDTEDPEQVRFARVEITPTEGDVFERDMAKWSFRLDQRIKPAWWGASHGARCRRAVTAYTKKHVVVDTTREEISAGRYWVGHGGIVRCVYDGGVVNSVRNYGIVQSVYGGVVHTVCDGGVVNSVRNDGIVRCVYDGGVVNSVRNYGIVQSVYGGVVHTVCNDGVVNAVRGDGVVRFVRDGGFVKSVGGGGVVEDVCDGVVVVYTGGVVKSIRGRAVVIDRSGDTPVIRVAKGWGYKLKSE